jgi:WD40 repeat protein
VKPLLIIVGIVCILGVAAFFVFHGVQPRPPAVAKQAEGPVGEPELTVITALAQSHDGHILATVNENKTVALWDAATGTNLRALESSPNEWVFAPAFSPDDSLLATAESSGGSDTHGSLLLWNPATGERLASVENLPWPNSVCFNPAGTLIAVGGTPALYLVDPSTKEIIRQVDRAHQNGAIQAMAFSPSGELLATAGRDGTVKLWKVPELNLVRTISAGQSVLAASRSELGPGPAIVGSVAFAHHHPRLAATTSEGKVLIWDLDSGREIMRYAYEDSAATGANYFQVPLGNSLSFTSDDRWLLTTDQHGTGIRLLGVDSKKEIDGLLTTHTDSPIEAMNVSAADGSVAFAYRVFSPGQKAQTKFEVWGMRLR